MSNDENNSEVGADHSIVDAGVDAGVDANAASAGEMISEAESINSEHAVAERAKQLLSPGKILADARLAADISLEQAAKELFMTPAKLRALESDQFDQFNSSIFVKGYLRSYAKLLKTDGDALVECFDALLAEQQPKKSTDIVHAIPENPHKHLWKFIAFIVSGLFAIYLISIWFFDKGRAVDTPAPKLSNAALDSNIGNLSVVQSASSVADVNAIAVDSISASAPNISGANSSASIAISSVGVAISSTQKSSTMSAQNTQSSEANNVALMVQTVNANAAKKGALDEISFSFRQESWLEVSDSRGDVLATELEPAGKTISLTGRAPFDVKLGNSPGVDIQINGKKIPVVPLMTSKVLIMKITTE